MAIANLGKAWNAVGSWRIHEPIHTRRDETRGKQFLPAAHDDGVIFGNDAEDIAALAGRESQPLPLTDGELFDTIVFGKHGACRIDNFSRSLLSRAPTPTEFRIRTA